MTERLPTGRRFAALKALHEAGHGMTFSELAESLGTSRGACGFVLQGLERDGYILREDGHSWRSAQVTRKGLHTLTMGTPSPTQKALKGSTWGGLGADGGTRFPTQVQVATVRDSVLKSGADNMKLGKAVTKGRHAGRHLFSLTLVEGKDTCPPCDLAKVCYGGNMHLAKRWAPGPELEAALTYEATHYAKLAHRRGESRYKLPLIRLHVLGDFYSEAYARLWVDTWGLPVFGYSHHHHLTPIGRILYHAPWETFSIRKSFVAGSEHGAVKKRGAVTVTDWEQAKTYDAIPCPVQTDDQATCATCGLCWNTERNIAFMTH